MADDLAAMGLSHEEVRYYAQEYEAGHAIVAIRPTGREWCRSAKPHDFLLVLATVQLALFGSLARYYRYCSGSCLWR